MQKLGLRIMAAAAFAVMSFSSVVPAMATSQSAPVTVTINRVASASISLSRSTFTWASLSDGTSQFFASDAGNTTVSGYIATSGSGSGSVAVQAPANITGTNSNVLPITSLAVTCSGGVLAGQTYSPADTVLAASSSTTCATYAANFHAAYSFTLGMFIDDRALPVDSWTSSGFNVVATAT